MKSKEADAKCVAIVKRIYNLLRRLTLTLPDTETRKAIQELEPIKPDTDLVDYIQSLDDLLNRAISALNFRLIFTYESNDNPNLESQVKQLIESRTELYQIADSCISEVVPTDSIGLDTGQPCKELLNTMYDLFLVHLAASSSYTGYTPEELVSNSLGKTLLDKKDSLQDKAEDSINYINEAEELYKIIESFKVKANTTTDKKALPKLNVWLEELKKKDWKTCLDGTKALTELEEADAKCVASVKRIYNLLRRLTLPNTETRKAVQELEPIKPDTDLVDYIQSLDDLINRAISILKSNDSPNVESQVKQLIQSQTELSQIADSCIAGRKSLNSYKETGQLNPVVPEPVVPSPDNPEIRNNICTKPSPDRWGVKFKYTVNGDGGNYGCPSSDGPASSEFATRHEWFLTLLPAMRSVMPANGGMDTPGALPGLQFQIRSNVAKHKVPGFQPIFQHMGVDSIIITMVGTFTGDGGLGGIYSLKPPEPKEEEPQVVNAELVEDVPDNLQKLEYVPWARQGKQHYLSSDTINPLWNKTIPTHNRALRPATGYTKEGGVTRANWNPYNSPNAGWENGIDPNAVKTSDEIPWENPDIYMTKNLLRAGMFDRDGCPGTCPSPELGDNSYDMYTGGLNIVQEQRLIGQDSDVSSAYTLRELSAYLDAYHEFTSFYKVAIHESREMEIEINLRKNHDGLNPQVNHFPKYARSALGMLRNDNGNPAFKGIVRDLRVFQARSDRTWYMMDIEVSDYGMAGKEPINLTNDLEERTKVALDELQKIRKEENKQDIRNDSDECGEAIIKAADIKIRLRSSSLGSKGDFFVIDTKSGYSTYAISTKRGNLEYNGNNPVNGSITDPRSTLKHLLNEVNAAGIISGGSAVYNALKKFIKELFASNRIQPKVKYEEKHYYGKELQDLNLERLTGFYILLVNWRAYLDKDTGYGIKTKSGLRGLVIPDSFELISPGTLFYEEVLVPANNRWKVDALMLINNPSIDFIGDNSAVTDCSGISSETQSTNTSNASGGIQAPPVRNKSSRLPDLTKRTLVNSFVDKLIGHSRSNGNHTDWTNVLTEDAANSLSVLGTDLPGYNIIVLRSSFEGDRLITREEHSWNAIGGFKKCFIKVYFFVKEDHGSIIKGLISNIKSGEEDCFLKPPEKIVS